MLCEALAWLTTPCSPTARRLGYLGAAIALEARARRCAGAWAGHLACCHAAVERSLTACPQRRCALVLGSGLALEYPLERLAQTFDRVVLCDMVHLKPLRRRMQHLDNVEIVEVDVGNVAMALAAGDGRIDAQRLAALPDGKPTAIDSLAAEADWILSANLLSQLPLLPVAYLRKHSPALDDAALEAFGRRLIGAHLDWLGRQNAHVTLIADAEQWLRDESGTMIEHTDFATPFELDRRSCDGWTWEIAPPGELADGLIATHRMVVCELGRQAR